MIYNVIQCLSPLEAAAPNAQESLSLPERVVQTACVRTSVKATGLAWLPSSASRGETALAAFGGSVPAAGANQTRHLRKLTVQGSKEGRWRGLAVRGRPQSKSRGLVTCLDGPEALTCLELAVLATCLATSN